MMQLLPVNHKIETEKAFKLTPLKREVSAPEDLMQEHGVLKRLLLSMNWPSSLLKSE
jgi:hypothetical protein